MQRNRLVVITLAGSLATAACGSSASDATPDSAPVSAVTADSVADATVDSIPAATVADTVPTVTDVPADTTADDSVPDEPTDSVPDTTVTETDSEARVGEAAGTAVAKLEEALDQSSDAGAYRISTSQGQTLQVPGLELDLVTELDPSAPAIIAEVDADGETISTIDIGALVGGEAFDFEVGLITWQDDTQVIVDTSAYEQLVEFDPTLETSPFRPGIFRVDADAARSSGVDDIVELIVGQSIPDPASLAVAFQSALGTAEAVDGEANTFEVSTTYAEFIEATGQDLETLARGTAAGIAPGIGVDVDALADLYVASYRAAPAEVRITVDETGVDTIELEADVSQIWELIPDLMAESDPTADVAQTAELFEGGVLLIEQFVDFDIDESIDVVLPEGDFEDRTDEVVALFTG